MKIKSEKKNEHLRGHITKYTFIFFKCFILLISILISDSWPEYRNSKILLSKKNNKYNK